MDEGKIKRKETSKKETSNSGEKLKGRRESYNQKKRKKTLQWGCLLAQEGIFRDQRGTWWKAYEAGRNKKCVRGLHRGSVLPQPESCVSCCEGGSVLEGGVWSMDLGRGQLLAAERQPEGKGGRSSATRKVCGKSPGHHRRKTSSLSGMQRAWTTVVTPFPTNQLRLPQAPGRALKLRPHPPA